MTLIQALLAAGLTPPDRLHPGRWYRFPGLGKKGANKAGWCKVIAPTFAVYGDWSTGLSETWCDDTHADTADHRRLLAETRERVRQFAHQQAERHRQAEQTATALIEQSLIAPHPYLIAKGFPDESGLVYAEQLLIPVRSLAANRLMSVQQIAPDGSKRFLPGGRVKGGIYRAGPPAASRIVLCEGYATGLSLRCALNMLPGRSAIVTCFSADNLVEVAHSFPTAVVAADNDVSGTGERAAVRTGLKWVMPDTTGDDFNDMHQRAGIRAVLEVIRGAL